jgi:biopolymer transport protein ExbD
MSWKVRHEGSPQPVEGLTAQQVAEGLNDGLWETTDEVMGPNDNQWAALETHPQFAEIAAEIEPPQSRTYDDETHLDFTALIDVTLVLLIFFILTASYAALQSRLDSPDLQPGTKGALEITPDKAREQMIFASIKLEGGKPVIRVEDKVVEEGKLQAVLKSYVSSTSKTMLLLDVDPKVTHGTTVTVQDAAAMVGITKVLRLVP